MKKLLAVLLALAMVFSMAACSSSESDTPASSSVSSDTEDPATDADSGENTDVETIKIASFFNFSGSNADTGILDGDGAQFAADYINNNGGIQSLGGAQIEIITGDTMTDVSQARAVAERVISENPDLVAAVGAGGSNYSIAMGSVFEINEIPYVQSGVSATIPEQGYTFTFQPVPNTFGQTQIEFIEYLNENYGYNITKVGIIYEDTDYGLSTAQGNLELAESAGLEVVFNSSFPANGSDVSSLITNLKASGAEMVLPVAFTQDAKLIFNTMSSMDYYPLILGGGGGFLYPAFGQELGDAVDGVLSVGSLNWDCATFENEAFADVAQQFEETYGYFMNEHSAATFNHVWLIAQALEACGTTDGAALAQAIRDLSMESLQPGVTNVVDFDEYGANLDAIPVIVQWQLDDDGQYRPHTVFPESQVTDGEFQVVG